MSRKSLSFTLLAFASFAFPAQGATAAGQDYQDGARGAVTLHQGDRSFADSAVDFTSGTGTIAETARDPEAALDAPDYSDVDDGSFLSLGCDGSVVLQFADNALVDIEGPDLYVFEVGPRVEGMALAVSEEGETWIELGEINGGALKWTSPAQRPPMPTSATCG